MPVTRAQDVQQGLRMLQADQQLLLAIAQRQPQHAATVCHQAERLSEFLAQSEVPGVVAGQGHAEGLDRGPQLGALVEIDDARALDVDAVDRHAVRKQACNDPQEVATELHATTFQAYRGADARHCDHQQRNARPDRGLLIRGLFTGEQHRHDRDGRQQQEHRHAPPRMR